MYIKAQMAHRLRAWEERGPDVGQSRVRPLADSSSRDHHLLGVRRLLSRCRRRQDAGGSNLACS